METSRHAQRAARRIELETRLKEMERRKQVLEKQLELSKKEEVDYFASILVEEMPNVPKDAIYAHAVTLVEEETRKLAAFMANRDLVPCTLITTEVGTTSMTFALEWDGHDLELTELETISQAKL